jgi:predicted phosphoadenosine phosphosulfate sulfurtransferase
MSGRAYLGKDVWNAALDRFRRSYAEGHRVVVSLSGGKDSGACVELAIIAATAEGRLPVDVVMRDEEIMFPGTFDYCERLAARPEVAMRWVIAHQPIVNAFDRANPYWWVFDQQLDPAEWVRQPPAIAEEIPDLDIRALVSPRYFPVQPGQELHCVKGLRVQESRNRMMGLHSSGGYLTGVNKMGVRDSRPIYDWTDGDIWLAHDRYHWDYNGAYDVMWRLGVKRRDLRISPPTMSPAAGDTLRVASQAWPDWWNRVCRRIPSVRTYAQFGRRAVVPQQRLGETWEDTFRRTCITDAPAWIAERAAKVEAQITGAHNGHSAAPLPQLVKCFDCGTIGSWKVLCQTMYQGDPFSMRVSLPYVDPEFFRPGAGRWSGPPSF